MPRDSLEQAVEELRRVNAQLARSHAGKRDAAAATLLRRLESLTAEVEAARSVAARNAELEADRAWADQLHERLLLAEKSVLEQEKRALECEGRLRQAEANLKELESTALWRVGSRYWRFKARALAMVGRRSGDV